MGWVTNFSGATGFRNAAQGTSVDHLAPAAVLLLTVPAELYQTGQEFATTYHPGAQRVAYLPSCGLGESS